MKTLKTLTLLALAALLAACDTRWPDYAGVMGAPAPETLAAGCPPTLAQGLTQSSR